jgi:hypothetical protein
MSFKQVVTYGEGSLTGLLGPMENGNARGGFPPQEMALESRNQLFIDGDRYRYENNNPVFGQSGQVYHRAMFSLFDGKYVKTFLPKGITGDKKPVGTVEASPLATEINEPVLEPIVRWARPLAPAFASRSISNARSTGVTATIDDDQCQEFELPLGSDVVQHYWLAVNRDYLVRRIATVKRDTILSQTDVRYKANDVCGWEPSSWVMNGFNGKGDLQVSQQVEVEAMNLNTSQADDRFEMLFPPDTNYYDATDGKTYRVQDDGTATRTKRMYGDELSETTVQPGDSWFRAHRWTLSLGIGAVCGCVLLIGYRGWKGRQTA